SMIFTAGVRAKTSIDRIGQALTTPEDMTESTEPEQPEQTGAIAMDLVSYTFPGQVQPVLRNVSFSIEPGQTAAIIGSTGCGKTTLINLLGRFFDADSGSVKIDGTDVRDMSFADLRRRIAYVPQESVLFTGSIDDNLRWGFPDAGSDDISRAVEIAQAAEFIDQMPEGLETRIGQGGVNVSGGQKQRLCIARALIRQAPILIMDDSTSAIDMGTEQQLRQALKKHCQGMTVIMIAQRIQSVMDADVIFVMNGGGIESTGTHRELLQTSTIYRDIFRSQIGLDLDGQEVI
ncbi:MAG: ABC transporter ATP-binding protein, partial [Bacillota bacterium]|nr:ABC transporter ATP-binding protein [Bacillota bacterium]